MRVHSKGAITHANRLFIGVRRAVQAGERAPPVCASCICARGSAVRRAAARARAARAGAG